MTWDALTARWDPFTGEVRAECGRLIGDDVASIQGHRDRLVGKLRERYAIGKDEAERRVDAWLDLL